MHDETVSDEPEGIDLETSSPEAEFGELDLAIGVRVPASQPKESNSYGRPRN